MAMINAVVIESTNAGDSSDAKVRAGLENRYYHLARQFIDEARARYETNKEDFGSQFEPSLIAILFSAFCLESYINFICLDRLGSEGVQKYVLCESRKDIKEKWKGVIGEITEKKGHKTSGEVLAKTGFWRPFCKLFDLRNKLVHYKEGFDEPVVTEWGNAARIYSEVNYKEAQMYVDAMDEMIHKFHEYEGTAFPFAEKIAQTTQVSIGAKAKIAPAGKDRPDEAPKKNS
jgi:hypothetical protein